MTTHFPTEQTDSRRQGREPVVHDVAYDPSPQVKRKRDTLTHWMMLGVVGLVLLLAVALHVENRTSVVVPGVNAAVPELCTFKRTLGMNCPGCGLTRCFISLAHGDLRSAWYYNPAGILLFGVVLFQIPYRMTQLWRIQATGDPLRLPNWIHWALIGFVILLVVQWVVRTVFGLF